MKLQKVVNVYILTLVFGICLGAAQAADWPNYRGPDHNGITSETDWKSNWGGSGPKELWKKSVGIGFSSMTVAGGRVYAMGNTGKKTNTDIIYCFDAVTGKENGPTRTLAIWGPSITRAARLRHPSSTATKSIH